MNTIKAIFRFIVGFGCTAFFSYWLLNKFMTVGDGTGIAIFIFAILVGIVSAIDKEEDNK